MEIVNDSAEQVAIKSSEVPEEIEEKVETPERPPWLPEKFKTPEALGASYENLERELTKKSQELSERNKLIDEYLLSSMKPKESTPKVDYSSLNEHGIPADQLGNLVSQDVKAHTSALEKEVKELKEQLFTLVNKTETMSLEPDYAKLRTDPEFINWAVKGFPPSILSAANKDPRSAAWLVGEYKKRFKASADETTDNVDTDRQPPPAGTGKGGRGSNKKVWTRKELTKMRAEDPDGYQRLWPEIEQAYREGRVK